jgi:hypothetical protein
MMVTARRCHMSLYPIYQIFFGTIALAVCYYFGLMKPRRTRAQREEDEHRELAAKWLSKDDGEK